VFVAFHHRCTEDPAHSDIKLDERHCAATAEFALRPQYTVPVLVPDFEAAGYRLEGVCKCFEPGAKVSVVHSHYARAIAGSPALSFFSLTTRIVLSGPIGRCPGARRGYDLATVEGVTVLKWDEGDLSFVLVGEQRETELRSIADGVRIALRANQTMSLALAASGSLGP
jgi:hypothetical protein